MSRESIRLKIYRAFQHAFVETLVLPMFFSKERLDEERGAGVLKQEFSPASIQVPRVWFHAASVGELEALWTVIESWADRDSEVILTVFSESARSHVTRLQKSLEGKRARILFCGYSPAEGRWGAGIEKVRPAAFVTAKYEAWPELWMTLRRHGIPLVIVGAKARRSLAIAKTMTALLGGKLPRMRLIAAVPSDGTALEEMFPRARVDVSGDPRWDRVVERARIGSSRARELVQSFSMARRPWGVLGSVWPQDLEVWGAEIAAPGGTLWVVPHRVDEKSLVQIDRMLRKHRLEPVRTSQAKGIPDGASEGLPLCVLVDEMGFLSELYSAADWAFVGGGFGYGVHSTIEPAVHGVPIGIGEKGAYRFPEIEQLRKTGQLAVVQSRADVGQWLRWAEASAAKKRGHWREQAERRLGATPRVVAAIAEEIVSHYRA